MHLQLREIIQVRNQKVSKHSQPFKRKPSLLCHLLMVLKSWRLRKNLNKRKRLKGKFGVWSFQTTVSSLKITLIIALIEETKGILIFQSHLQEKMKMRTKKRITMLTSCKKRLRVNISRRVSTIFVEVGKQPLIWSLQFKIP